MAKATPPSTDKRLEAALRRPSIEILQQKILETVREAHEPTTPARVFIKLKEKEEFNVYMSDISKAIWRMVSDGLIVVEGGRLQATEMAESKGRTPAKRRERIAYANASMTA
jgi:hypothetical protein